MKLLLSKKFQKNGIRTEAVWNYEQNRTEETIFSSVTDRKFVDKFRQEATRF